MRRAPQEICSQSFLSSLIARSLPATTLSALAQESRVGISRSYGEIDPLR